MLLRRSLRTGLVLAAVAAATELGRRVPGVNAATMGFFYLLLVLGTATAWGFVEALGAALAATLLWNYAFLPPVGRLTIADPQNWVALFSFLATALVASRLSSTAQRRTAEARARRQEMERLYHFSRALLLIEPEEPFARQLTRKLAQAFDLESVMLFDRLSGEYHRAGAELEGWEERLRQVAEQDQAEPVLAGGYAPDASRWSAPRGRVGIGRVERQAEDFPRQRVGIWQGTPPLGLDLASGEPTRPLPRRAVSAPGTVALPVRLGAGPIAALALRPDTLPEPLREGLANLVAIALEHARAQELEAQVVAAERGERLRTALLDALEHEFKTPLTSVLAATSALLAMPEAPRASRAELLQVADEEARRLRQIMDDALAMARLDGGRLRPEAEALQLGEVVREALASLGKGSGDHPVGIRDRGAAVRGDRRLLRLAVKQLLDNALKYSPAGAPVEVEIRAERGQATIVVADQGAGIPAGEQGRIFDRLYRGPAVADRIPGSGLGLGIALSIARAHGGELTVRSRPGETEFRLTLPQTPEAAA